ncbi:hypothetical protein EDC96DRAFT_158933 [Choanephora cucurbitarum]|nr:hypothetical protein EDC96DRAFT_158933 [Choanephora cucurbitarum]
MIMHEKEITLKEKTRVLFFFFLFSLVSFKLQSHLYYKASTAAKSSFALYSFLHLSWCSLIVCVFLFSQTSCQTSPLLSTMLFFGLEL